MYHHHHMSTPGACCNSGGRTSPPVLDEEDPQNVGSAMRPPKLQSRGMGSRLCTLCLVLGFCLLLAWLGLFVLRAAASTLLHAHADLSNAVARSYPDTLIRFRSLVEARDSPQGVDEAPVDYDARERIAFPDLQTDGLPVVSRRRIFSAIGLLVDRVGQLERALQPQ